MPQKLKQAVEAYEGLSVLVKRDEETPFLPYKTKLQIATRLRKLKDDFTTFENEKMALGKKFGSPTYRTQTKQEIEAKMEPEVNGYTVTKNADSYKAFTAAFNTLLESEATAEPIFPLALDSLGENKLSTQIIMALQDAGVLAKEEEAAPTA